MKGVAKTKVKSIPEFGLPSWSPDAQHLYASLRMGVKQSFQILGWPMKAISQASG
jgi:hypothetical protein